jgi:sugar phosphate isomerase/epimerase
MKRNALKGLEIRNVDGTNITDISLEKAREVRKQLDDNGLVTWSIGSPIGKQKIAKDFAPELERFKHTLELAHELGAGNIRLFSFFMPKEEDPAIYRNEVIDRMGQFIEAARGSGVFLCHENEKGIYGDIADRCLDLHQQLPELKGIFDPANFVQCHDDTIRGWSLLKNYIHYLHIKDALVSGDVVPAGHGAGNVAYIVKEFMAQGGEAMTVEPHLRIFDGLKALEEGAKLAK